MLLVGVAEINHGLTGCGHVHSLLPSGFPFALLEIDKVSTQTSRLNRPVIGAILTRGNDANENDSSRVRISRFATRVNSMDSGMMVNPANALGVVLRQLQVSHEKLMLEVCLPVAIKNSSINVATSKLEKSGLQSSLPRNRNSPSKIVNGCGGQPGMNKSTGTTELAPSRICA